MRVTNTGLSRSILALLAGTAYFASAQHANAQDCNLPTVPDGTITATQDRDQMMCQVGVALPVLPLRMDDPNKPVNAFPKVPANPEGNWTDAQGHTVVRTNFGAWHTYDSFTYATDVTTRATGGAMAPFGDFGPLSTPRYPDIDLLKMKSGDAVAIPEDWWTKRRPEILKDVQDNLYGHIPDRSLWPAITWSAGAITTGTANGVAYQQRVLTGAIDTTSYPSIRNVPRIQCTLRTPADKDGQKVPVIITFGSVNSWQYTAPRGYGICAFSPGTLQPDSGGANLSSYIIGLINKGNWRKPDDWGALAAWSWGISRLIDYFETDPEMLADVDATKLGLEGHSRYGKATLVAAAFDDRIVVALPSSAGALGTAPARRAYGETLEFVASATNEYHWVAGNIMKYAGEKTPGQFWPRKVIDLTVDAHSVVSLIAPRGVMINGGTDTPRGNGDAWQDPRGMYLTGLTASPVWTKLGVTGLVIPATEVFTSGLDESAGGTPPFDKAFIDGNVGYRRHTQGHTDAPTWPSFVEMAAKYFDDNRPVVAAGQTFEVGTGSAGIFGKVAATDADSGDTLRAWQIKGGTGAYKFAIEPSNGQLTIADAGAIDFAGTGSYTLTVTVSDGKLSSKDETVTITVPEKVLVCKKGKAVEVARGEVAGVVSEGGFVGTCSTLKSPDSSGGGSMDFAWLSLLGGLPFLRRVIRGRRAS